MSAHACPRVRRLRVQHAITVSSAGTAELHNVVRRSARGSATTAGYRRRRPAAAAPCRVDRHREPAHARGRQWTAASACCGTMPVGERVAGFAAVLRHRIAAAEAHRRPRHAPTDLIVRDIVARGAVARSRSGADDKRSSRRAASSSVDRRHHRLGDARGYLRRGAIPCGELPTAFRCSSSPGGYRRRRPPPRRRSPLAAAPPATLVRRRRAQLHASTALRGNGLRTSRRCSAERDSRRSLSAATVPTPAGSASTVSTFDLLEQAHHNAARLHEHGTSVKEALPWDGVIATEGAGASPS